MPTESAKLAKARALLAAWTRAQNEHDFTSYAALYGTRFYGVRRTGERTETFDRRGWLSDRRRIFATAPRVTVGEPTFIIIGHTIHVRFVQTYETDRFRDIGPKRLVLENEGDALVIAVETMLSSRVVGDAVAVFLVAGGAAVIDDAAHNVAHGPVVETENGLVADARRADLLHERLTFVRSDFTTCSGVIERVALHGTPALTYGDERHVAVLDAEARRVYAWSSAAYRVLAYTDATCAGDAVLAFREGGIAPALVPARVLRGLEKIAYVERFTASRVGRLAESRFASELVRARALRANDPDVARAHPVLLPNEWAILDRSASLTRGFGGAFDVTVFETPHQASFVVYEGRGAYGELFAFTYGALFEGEQALDVLPEGFERGVSSIVLLDVEGDGRMEAVLRGRRGTVLVRLADARRDARLLLDARLGEDTERPPTASE